MYSFYLGTVLFPVAPGELQTKMKNQNSELVLINEGELNILKSAGLSEFSFKLLLPWRQYSFAKYAGGKFQKPSYFLEHLRKLKKDKKAFDFTVIKDSVKSVYTKATLEDYSIEESAGEAGDIIVSISLKQYVHFATRTVKIKDGSLSEKPSRDPSTSDKGKKYTVKQDDTLWGIARKELGNSSKWEIIYKANKKLLDDTAKKRGFGSEMGYHWIFPGTVITIP